MESRYTIREPEKNDAKQIYDLVKKSKVLDLNSHYLYLLQTTHLKIAVVLLYLKTRLLVLFQDII
jgi:L-2,4-diaminobutyric acid acetyltransferase